MTFREFREEMRKHWAKMCDEATALFVVDADGNELYERYQSAFAPGDNMIYRKRPEHDCSSCRHFINQVGGAVEIKHDGSVVTIWGFKTGDQKYQRVCDTMDRFVKSLPIKDVLLASRGPVGHDHDMEYMDGGIINQYDHLNVMLPRYCIVSNDARLGEMQSEARIKKNVLKRALEEIQPDAVDTVLELIASNTLYKGQEWKASISQFKEFQKFYRSVDKSKKDNVAWLKAAENVNFARIRNTSIGTLLVNISEGMDLEQAVTQYERITAPENYKRPKAIFTQRMLEDARKKIEELGYLDSLPRRFATLNDITVNNILFANRNIKPSISGGMDATDFFGQMQKDMQNVNPKRFDRVEEISEEKFVNDVLPTAQTVELFFENRFAKNMVSLIAPINRDAKSMFKWGNPFSWAYSGNVTDSLMKEHVKAAGGKIDGVLRFSIMWNDVGSHNRNDEDAHCIEPGGYHIFFGRKIDNMTGGMLDVDITHPALCVPAVENITWPDIDKMKEGLYQFFVHTYCGRCGRGGFRAEIEFDGQIYHYDYHHDTRTGRDYPIANVILKDGKFTIVEHMPSNISSMEVWGLKTNQFIPVSIICYSPNYWDEQKGIGHQHLFFMLNGCTNTEEPNGFYNEFLNNELTPHKRVMEALGGKAHVQSADNQLSGVGFSMTKRSDVIVKVTGATERIMRVMF